MRGLLIFVFALALAGPARADDADNTLSCNLTSAPPICNNLKIDKLYPDALSACQAYFTAATKAVQDVCQAMKEGTTAKAPSAAGGTNQQASQNVSADQLQQMADFSTKWTPAFKADVADVDAKYDTLDKAVKKMLDKANKNGFEEIMRCGVAGSPVSFQLRSAGKTLADYSHAQMTYTHKLMNEVMLPLLKDLSSANTPAAISRLRAAQGSTAGSIPDVDSEAGFVGEMTKTTLLYHALKVAEARAGDVLVEAVEGIEHVHVSIAFTVIGAAIDVGMRLHSHSLDRTDYVFIAAGLAPAAAKTWGGGLVLTLFVAAAEYYIRSSERDLVKQGYGRYEQWFNGQGYEATKNYAQDLSQIYDSSQVSSSFHDKTVIDNTPDPMNRGLPKNPNPTFQCPTNHSCTAAAVWPKTCGDASWF